MDYDIEVRTSYDTVSGNSTVTVVEVDVSDHHHSPVGSETVTVGRHDSVGDAVAEVVARLVT